MEALSLLVVLAIAVAFGACARNIATSKGHPGPGWFWYGFFLGVIALIHVTVIKQEAVK